MKKLLSVILVICSLLCGNAYAEEIMLDKCYPSYRNSYNSDQLNHHYFKINTSRKIMNSVVNWKKKQENLPKVHIVQYNLNFIDTNFVKGFVAELDGSNSSIEVIVDLNEKTILIDGVSIITCE